MIDTSYLKLPDQDSWGYTNVDDSNIISAFTAVNDIVSPVNVLEIGMFAGHSTLLMLSLFKNIKTITSYDPSKVSLHSAPEILKRFPQFQFHNSPIWGHEDDYVNSNIDLIYVDGDHQTPSVLKDIVSSFHILPRFILFDNVEHGGVSGALRRSGLYNVKYNPKYFFYTNTFKNQHKPGILMLIDLQNITDADIITVLTKASDV